MKNLKKIAIMLAIIIIGALIIVWISSFRRDDPLAEADLLLADHPSGIVSLDMQSDFYALNSKTGKLIRLAPASAAEVNSNQTNKEALNEEWADKLAELDLEFVDLYIAGQLNDDAIIFVIQKSGRDDFDMYKYTVSDNQYELITPDEKISNCVAGFDKIFCRTHNPPENPIYKYDMISGEKSKITSNESDRLLSLSLEAVLK